MISKRKEFLAPDSFTARPSIGSLICLLFLLAAYAIIFERQPLTAVQVFP